MIRRLMLTRRKRLTILKSETTPQAENEDEGKTFEERSCEQGRGNEVCVLLIDEKTLYEA